jgi:hypothetical protein
MKMNKLLICTAIALLIPAILSAQGAAKKTVALGDVQMGYDGSSQKSYEVKETIQIGLKKRLEKLSKGSYNVEIVDPAVVTRGSKPAATAMPTMPTDRAPTQNEIAQYMASMQQMQRQMMGQVKVHQPVNADDYFEFRISSSKSDTDTGMTASSIAGYSGYDTTPGDVSFKRTKLYLIATQRNPKTGALIDKHTCKASATKVRNIAGYTTYNYGNDEITRERLFKKAIKDCAKWINGRVKK